MKLAFGAFVACLLLFAVIVHARNERLGSNQATLSVTPDILQSSGDSATVSWSNVANPQPDDFVGVFAPSSAAAPIGTLLVVGSKTWASGYGQLEIPLVNMRTDYIFGLFLTNPANSSEKILSATSNNLKFVSSSEPLQVHLAMGENVTEMRVMWVSEDSSSPIVQFGPSNDPQQWTAVQGTSASYTMKELCAAPANLAENFFDPGLIHDVLLTNLSADTVYFYRCGSDAGGWTDVYQFRTGPLPGSPVNIVAYGDMGVTVPFNITALGGDQQWESKSTLHWVGADLPQMVLHIGDISYARGYSFLWDYFFNKLQPVAARVPYMVCIGNHEYDYLGQPFKPSWSDYNTDSGGECGVPYTHRFHMPGPEASRNLWYSYNFGNVHFLLMSTEHDFTVGSDQYNWIVQDLASVDRSVTPWIVFSGHRPMYDTSSSGPNYGPVLHFRQSLEPVLVKYKVNLALWGHVHKYERTCGLNNFVCAEDDSDSPVHVVIGMAGNDYQDPWEGVTPNSLHVHEPDWIIFRSMNYGYTRFQTNSTHLHFQYLNNQRNQVHDEFFLHL